MGQVKIKFNKIHETLDNYEISRPREQLIDDFFTLYRSLHHIVRYANDINDYGSEFSKKFYAVSRLKEKIESLVLAASFNPVKEIDKKMLKLTKRILCKAHMTEAAYKIIASMTSLDQDPVADMAQVIFDAEFDKDIKKLKKRMKEHVLRVIANSPEKPNIDYDKLLEEEMKEEQPESCVPVTVNMVVGIRDVHSDAMNLNKNTYWEDGVVKAEVVHKGKTPYLKLTRLTCGVEDKVLEFKISRRPEGGSTVQKQVNTANNLVKFINEVGSLESCSAVDVSLLAKNYGFESALLRAEPEDDKNQLFEKCERLSIYVDIMTDSEKMAFLYVNASVFNEYAYRKGLSKDHYLDYEISECEDFESKFNPDKMFVNMQPLIQSEL